MTDISRAIVNEILLSGTHWTFDQYATCGPRQADKGVIGLRLDNACGACK
jgi:hypothetical protein